MQTNKRMNISLHFGMFSFVYLRSIYELKIHLNLPKLLSNRPTDRTERLCHSSLSCNMFALSSPYLIGKHNKAKFRFLSYQTQIAKRFVGHLTWKMRCISLKLRWNVAFIVRNLSFYYLTFFFCFRSYKSIFTFLWECKQIRNCFSFR